MKLKNPTFHAAWFAAVALASLQPAQARAERAGAGSASGALEQLGSAAGGLGASAPADAGEVAEGLGRLRLSLSPRSTPDQLFTVVFRGGRRYLELRDNQLERSYLGRRNSARFNPFPWSGFWYLKPRVVIA